MTKRLHSSNNSLRIDARVCSLSHRFSVVMESVRFLLQTVKKGFWSKTFTALLLWNQTYDFVKFVKVKALSSNHTFDDKWCDVMVAKSHIFGIFILSFSAMKYENKKLLWRMSILVAMNGKFTLNEVQMWLDHLRILNIPILTRMLFVANRNSSTNSHTHTHIFMNARNWCILNCRILVLFNGVANIRIYLFQLSALDPLHQWYVQITSKLTQFW